jgi:peptide/nickel transport system substrate-binding protein
MPISRQLIVITLIVIIIVASFAVWYVYYFLPASKVIKELRIGIKMEDVSLDPQIAKSTLGASIIGHINENLVDLEFKDGKVVGVKPKLAVSWRQINETTIEFKLRQGVKFHCGHEFTAEDVKFTYERLLKKFNAWVLGPITKFEVVDKYTIRIGTDKPYAPMLFHLALFYGAPILCSECVRKYGDDYGTKYACGTGPYKFVEWIKGEKIVLEKNEEYWGEKPKIDRLIFKPIADDSARVMALMSGDVDVITHVPPPQIKTLKDAGFNVIVVPSVRISYIGINTVKPPFSDKRVRQAICYAIDRKSIIDKLLAGLGEVADSFLPPAAFGYVKIGFPYDPEKAKKLLAEAGYPNGFDCEFWTCEGRYLMDRQVSEAVVGYLAAIGIRAKITVFEWGAYCQKDEEQMKMYAEGKTPTYDMMYWAWSCMTYDPDWTFAPNFVSPQLKLPGSWNDVFFSNSTFDDLVLSARATSDPNVRLQLYAKAQKILAEECPWAPIFVEPIIVAARPDLEGIIILPNEGYFFYAAYFVPKVKEEVSSLTFGYGE